MEAPLLLPVSTAAGSSSISIIDDDSTVVEEAALSCPPPGTNESSSFVPSTGSIVFRVVAVLVVACASLVAQHEASKGFAISVVTNGGGNTPAGRRFHLFFVSNGRAERIVHRASRHVERALFPDASFPRKRVTRVTVALAGHNLTADDATVKAARSGEEYVISLSPGLLTTSSASSDKAVAAAVRRAVARMWLWDGRGAAPARVTDSMVDYLASSSGADEETMMTWRPEENKQCMSARFLRHLEHRRRGFVARLNRAMKDRWSDAAVDAALGAPARPVCAAYLAATTLPATDSTSDGTRGSNVAL